MITIWIKTGYGKGRQFMYEDCVSWPRVGENIIFCDADTKKSYCLEVVRADHDIQNQRVVLYVGMSL